MKEATRLLSQAESRAATHYHRTRGLVALLNGYLLHLVRHPSELEELEVQCVLSVCHAHELDALEAWEAVGAAYRHDDTRQSARK